MASWWTREVLETEQRLVHPNRLIRFYSFKATPASYVRSPPHLCNLVPRRCSRIACLRRANPKSHHAHPARTGLASPLSLTWRGRWRCAEFAGGRMLGSLRAGLDPPSRSQLALLFHSSIFCTNDPRAPRPILFPHQVPNGRFGGGHHHSLPQACIRHGRRSGQDRQGVFG